MFHRLVPYHKSKAATVTRAKHTALTTTPPMDLVMCLPVPPLLGDPPLGLSLEGPAGTFG